MPPAIEWRQRNRLALRPPTPWWVTCIYVAFLAWTVTNADHPALFVGGFLFFLGFDWATAAYSTLEDFMTHCSSDSSSLPWSSMGDSKAGGLRR